MCQTSFPIGSGHYGLRPGGWPAKRLRALMDRRTRIVATLGPATDNPRALDGIIAAGVDVFRINFAHGTGPEHLRRIDAARAASGRLRRPVAILGDLPGPKLRVHLHEPMPLQPGQPVTLSSRPNSTAAIGVTEPECIADVLPGQRILLDDGRLQLTALEQKHDHLVARVIVGGTLLPNKGVNLPDTRLGIAALTERDRQALAVAATARVDWLALSFVRSADAASALRDAAAAVGLFVPILAKMERPEAVEHAAAIITAFDGVMVARGDLGVEIPLERVPAVQKKLISMARAAGKPVITATDMLDSMRQSPRPTRAEASDVANAIYDGTDAIMLSGETAIGDYPLEAVQCMDRIARETEAALAGDSRYDLKLPPGPIDDHLTELTCELAAEVRADAIITPTYSGRTARLVARHRPAAAIVAPAPSQTVMRQMQLIWGVRPVELPEPLPPGADRLEAAVRAAFRQGGVVAGQLAIVLAGHPSAGGSRFPTVRLVRIGPAGESVEPQT